MDNEKARKILLDLFHSAINAAHPATCLPDGLPGPGKRIIVIGAGKGSAMMVYELEKRWPGRLEGIVVTRYVYAVYCSNIEIIEAGHPVPDENSVRAAKKILRLVNDLDRDDLVIALISGGGSALLCLPPTGLQRYLKSDQAVTPGRNSDVFHNTSSSIIASSMQSLQVAQRRAQELDFTTICLGELEGEAVEVGRVHAGVARSIARFGVPVKPPPILLSGGEVTVTLNRQETGQGGPKQEFLLGLALSLNAHSGIHAIACDTDGMDGSKPVAGAVVHPDTLKRAEMQEIFARDFLSAHNSYDFFNRLDDSVDIGSTYTNVNDFRVIFIE